MVRQLRRWRNDQAFRGDRRPVAWYAELTTGNSKFPCDVVDISDGGAKLRLPWPLPPDTTKVWLIIDFVGVIAAEPLWRKRDFLGLRFLPEPGFPKRLERIESETRHRARREGPDSAA